MQYSNLIQKLFAINRFTGMKLGLQNCRRMNEVLGQPINAFNSIHVAGTNGKGTVTKKIAAGLEAAGKMVGHYTSPHISCFRERIRINGEMIPESAVEEILPEIFSICQHHNIPATFFELTTFLAFKYFAMRNVDAAVLETGLGGRLDATNIVIPQLSVITSISLEHTDVLGKTIEEIANEKAWIIKPDVPVVLGPRMPHEIFQNFALYHNSPCTIVKGEYKTFDDENTAIAKAALEVLKIPEEALRKGLESRLPCRFEVLNVNSACVILDVAHNPDGIKHLFNAIRLRYPDKTIRVICGLSKNKDIFGIFEVLKFQGCHIHLVEAQHERAAPIRALRYILDLLEFPDSRINEDESIHRTVQTALAKAIENDELLVVCGTFFIMAEVREALGIAEPKDLVNLN